MAQSKTPSPDAATGQKAPPLPPTVLIAAPAYDDDAKDFRQAVASAARSQRDRPPRKDGWSPPRIRAFLTALSRCGVVSDACRAVGISLQSAYRLRNSAGGRAFRHAWDAAILLGRQRLADAAMSRAMHGWIETIHRGGEVWGSRNRYDNHLTMAMLTRLDEKAKGYGENAIPRLIADEFDTFLDIVCAGGEGAADFIASRRAARASETELLGGLESCRQLAAAEEAGADPPVNRDDTVTAGNEAEADEEIERTDLAHFLADLDPRLAAEIRDRLDLRKEE